VTPVYLHLGGDRVVRLREIVAILSAEGSAARAYAAQAEAQGRLVPSPEEPVHAYVVTRDRVYASPISTTTLARRAEQGAGGRRER